MVQTCSFGARFLQRKCVSFYRKKVLLCSSFSVFSLGVCFACWEGMLEGLSCSSSQFFALISLKIWQRSRPFHLVNQHAQGGFLFAECWKVLFFCGCTKYMLLLDETPFLFFLFPRLFFRRNKCACLNTEEVRVGWIFISVYGRIALGGRLATRELVYCFRRDASMQYFGAVIIMHPLPCR